ncbi:MAG: GtrA family protein [Caulobacterales bacterium]
MKLPTVVREVNFFVVVGLMATVTHYFAALAAQRFGGLGPIWSSVAGYLSSVGVSYVGNSLLTFRRPVMHGPQFARFAVISLAGLAINLSIIFVFTRFFGWPLKLALVPVVLVVPASTFLMAKFWAFRYPLAEPAA